jgi:integrase
MNEYFAVRGLNDFNITTFAFSLSGAVVKENAMPGHTQIRNSDEAVKAGWRHDEMPKGVIHHWKDGYDYMKESPGVWVRVHDSDKSHSEHHEIEQASKAEHAKPLIMPTPKKNRGGRPKSEPWWDKKAKHHIVAHGEIAPVLEEEWHDTDPETQAHAINNAIKRGEEISNRRRHLGMHSQFYRRYGKYLNHDTNTFDIEGMKKDKETPLNENGVPVLVYHDESGEKRVPFSDLISVEGPHSKSGSSENFDDDDDENEVDDHGAHHNLIITKKYRDEDTGQFGASMHNIKPGIDPKTGEPRKGRQMTRRPIYTGENRIRQHAVDMKRVVDNLDNLHALEKVTHNEFAKHLSDPNHADHENAMMLKLLSMTGARVGNKYSSTSGISSLKKKHLIFDKKTGLTKLSFVGKKGVPHEYTLPPELATRLQYLTKDKKADDAIFSPMHVDPTTGEKKTTSSPDQNVRRYMMRILDQAKVPAGTNLTPHDVRRYYATKKAIEIFSKIPPPQTGESSKDYNGRLVEGWKKVAEEVHHVSDKDSRYAKHHYVDPILEQAWVNGDLEGLAKKYHVEEKMFSLLHNIINKDSESEDDAYTQKLHDAIRDIYERHVDNKPTPQEASDYTNGWDPGRKNAYIMPGHGVSESDLVGPPESEQQD